MTVLRGVWFALLYYVSWFMFGLGGLLLNLLLTPLLILPRRERFGPLARRAIRGMFQFWLKWLHATGVVDVRWRGFDHVVLPAGTVYVANHPTLVDATFLLARLPDAVCIFKPALLRNPAIGPAARLAGYVAGDQGVDTLRSAAEAVAAGCSLLVFPEGTRTEPGQSLNPLKSGFALIARRAAAPIQLFRLSASRNLVPRGRPWWWLPDLPGWVEIERDEFIAPDEIGSTPELITQVETRLRRELGGLRES
jgi:1-acyl-sn-glycerol-3-phosphate acyltransferase